jgi:hypothetical protein
LVLQRAEAIVFWNPETGEERIVVPDGRYLASSPGRLAWVTDAGVSVLTAGRARDETSPVFVIDGKVMPGSTFSEDGQRLAVALLREREGELAKSVVTVIDLDSGRSEDIVGRTIRALAWASNGDLMWVGEDDVLTRWIPGTGEAESFEPQTSVRGS